MEEYLSDVPKAAELRPAWEEDLKHLDEAEQAYKRGEVPKKPEPEKVSEEAPVVDPEEEKTPEAPAVALSPRQGMQAAMHGTPVVAASAPVAKPTPKGAIKVSLSRVIRRAEAAGYPMCSWKQLPDVLYAFAEVLVAEVYNARERRSNLEIPWPLPLEPGASRCEYVCRVDGKLTSLSDILEFNYAGYLRENGLTPVIVMTDVDETYEFFHK